MNKKGVLLALGIIAVIVLAVLAAGMLLRSISERNLAQRYSETTRAFWVAEAGINRALNELRSNYNATGTALLSGTLNGGRYLVDLSNKGVNKQVVSHGFFPASGERIEYVIEAEMSRFTPPNFFENAVYSAGDVDLNGSAYSVTGDVYYADEIDNPDNIVGTVTQDPSISPLARLNFQRLRTISESQGNIYDGDRLKEVAKGTDSFPASFWYTPPPDPADPTSGTPNVIYVESDLELRGNLGTIGGFFVVVGNVLTDPLNTQDASINGNGEIEGAIYTRGEFDINGGGGGLNVNGGVWGGEEVELNGNARIAYNPDYMAAIDNLNVEGDVQIISWKDDQKPYPLTP